MLATLPVYAAVTPADASKAAYAGSAFQTELPLKGPEKAAPLVGAGSSGFVAIPGADLILYLAVAVMVTLFAWSLRDYIPAFGRRLEAKGPALVERQAAVQRMVETRLEADELARQGNFAEAMHALLLRSLSEMRRILSLNFADSLTSREIVEVVRLPGAGSTSLRALIGQVELVYFGLRPADASDYETCRQNYEAVTTALSQGGVA